MEVLKLDVIFWWWWEHGDLSRKEEKLRGGVWHSPGCSRFEGWGAVRRGGRLFLLFISL